MLSMTTGGRLALLVAALVLSIVVVLALVAASFAAFPVTLVLAAAAVALVVGLRSHVRLPSRRRAARHGRDPWAAAVAPPALDGPSWTTTWDALPSASTISEVRARTAATLTEWNLRGEATEPTLLVLTELMTNAIEHSCPPLRLTLGLGEDFVRIEVHDATSAPPRSCRRTDERGRGLAIVAGLSLRHGWAPEPCGKLVWADVGIGWPD
jgi:histidine kinase-like protein